jgi:hypothetical protein
MGAGDLGPDGSDAVACAVCGDDLTPHGHQLFALMGCHDATGCPKVCAHCVGRDLTQLMVDGAKLRCAGRTHALLNTALVLDSLATAGLVEPPRVAAWSARLREVEEAIAAHAARRAWGAREAAPRARDFALVGSRVEGCPVKRCPSCGAACIKVDGCNQVSCSLCHESFRWCCLALGTMCRCDPDWEGGRGRQPVVGRGGLRRPLIQTGSPPPRHPPRPHPRPFGWTPRFG